MRTLFFFRQALPGLLAATALLAHTTIQAAADCDRACLLKINDQFNTALLKHDTKGLPLASKVKATQNLQPLTLGEGIWKKATPFTATWKLADPDSGQVATVGFFHVDGRGAYFISRLRVVDKKITESEFFFTRRGETIFFNPDDPTSFDAALSAALPADKRTTREDLVLMADENIQATAMGGTPFKPTKLKRGGKILGGENGYDIPASVMTQGGPPRMPGAPIVKAIMERDPEDTDAPAGPPMQGGAGGGAPQAGAAGPNAQGGPGAAGGMGGGGKAQVMRERRHPLVDTERGLVLSYFIMGGRPPKDGEKTDWDKYYGQPEPKGDEVAVIPVRSAYRIFITKYSGGELIANDQYEREIAPYVVSGYRDANTLGPN
ncbi:MAG: hypothetical protein QM800_06535 [Paludibacter sp.]